MLTYLLHQVADLVPVHPTLLVIVIEVLNTALEDLPRETVGHMLEFQIVFAHQCLVGHQ